MAWFQHSLQTRNGNPAHQCLNRSLLKIHHQAQFAPWPGQRTYGRLTGAFQMCMMSKPVRLFCTSAEQRSQEDQGWAIYLQQQHQSDRSDSLSFAVVSPTQRNKHTYGGNLVMLVSAPCCQLRWRFRVNEASKGWCESSGLSPVWSLREIRDWEGETAGVWCVKCLRIPKDQEPGLHVENIQNTDETETCLYSSAGSENCCHLYRLSLTHSARV